MDPVVQKRRGGPLRGIRDLDEVEIVPEVGILRCGGNQPQEGDPRSNKVEARGCVVEKDVSVDGGRRDGSVRKKPRGGLGRRREEVTRGIRDAQICGVKQHRGGPGRCNGSNRVGGPRVVDTVIMTNPQPPMKSLCCWCRAFRGILVGFVLGWAARDVFQQRVRNPEHFGVAHESWQASPMEPTWRGRKERQEEAEGAEEEGETKESAGDPKVGRNPEGKVEEGGARKKGRTDAEGGIKDEGPGGEPAPGGPELRQYVQVREGEESGDVLDIGRGPRQGDAGTANEEVQEELGRGTSSAGEPVAVMDVEGAGRDEEEPVGQQLGVETSWMTHHVGGLRRGARLESRGKRRREVVDLPGARQEESKKVDARSRRQEKKVEGGRELSTNLIARSLLLRRVEERGRDLWKKNILRGKLLEEWLGVPKKR